jgi:hypothetical protein
MFSLPQQATDEQEGTEKRPIPCEDTVEAFRAWCWVLYAGSDNRLISDKSASL